MNEALALGLAYGLTAGIAPGPLLALVVTSSLHGGVRAGLLVAVAPLITDAFILIAALTVLSQLSDRSLGVIGFLGSLLLLRFAVDTVRDARTADPMAGATRRRRARRYVSRGAIVNALSPYPYLFWLTIGGPQIVRLADTKGRLEAGAFIAGFVVLLVGVKAVVAIVVGGARRRIGGRFYRGLLAATGVLLGLLGVVLGLESIRLIV
jgi:threonine/homoserine/homoserine lactone efflux protein